MTETGTPRRILVVEDSRTQAERVRLLLEQDGHVVDTARTGIEGLERVRTARPDLIVSDVMMPEMDGYAFCQAIKSYEATRRIPFILFTERHEPMDIVEGLLRGADNFIPKSSSDEYLLERVRRILDQLEHRRGAELTVEILVRVGGREIPISADKQQIFELLVATLEETARVNEKFRQAQEQLARHARELEEAVERRTRELRRAEQRYHTLVERAHDGIVVLDAAGRVLEINEQMEELLGRPRGEILGRSYLDLVATAEHDEARAALQELLAKGEIRGERHLRRPDGRLVPVEFSAAVVDVGDEKLGLAIVRDMTERRRVEDALRASAGQLSSIFSNVADILYYLAVEGEEQYRFLRVNPAFLAATGLSEGQVVGRLVNEVIPEPSRALVLDKYREAIRGGKTVRWEETTAYPSGVRTGEVSVTPILDAKGRCTHLIGTVHDYTERKRAEAELARLGRAVEQAAEAIVITDLSGTILYVNPAFERISGYPRAEALGQNPRIVKSGRHDAGFYRELWDTLVKGEVWHGRLVNRSKDGSFYEVEATISPVRDTGGRVVNYVALQRDLTQERRLEEQLAQSQKMEAIGRLAGGVAHDFNNLLGVITGYGELTLRDLPPEHRSKKRVEQILRAAGRATTLTRQLLTFSRKEVVQPRVLDLNHVVAEVEKMLRRLIGEDVQLVTALAEDLGRVRADPGQMEQVLLNLAVNARDAMPRGGKLILETSNVVLDERYARTHAEARTGPHVLLAVSDTGHGIDPETLPRIFEPFFTTKEAGKGTGLGLSTVYGIVKQSGGHVGVYSEPGRGSTFKVYLPRVKEEAADADEAPTPGTTPARGSETVLLVEDDPSLRSMIRELLEEGGYTVVECATPGQAVAVAGARAVQILLTDVILPGMSGPDLARRLRETQPTARVLYISGYTNEAVGHHGLLDPTTHFLQKPFTADALLRRVREVLDAREGPP